MTQLMIKFALCALALATAVDIARHRRSETERLARKEALRTWEEEGGSLPSPK